MIKFLKKIFKRKPKYTLYELGSMAADRNDFAAAFKCFVSDAKKNNNPQSQFLTGFFLYHGTGVKKNYEYALQWFELAAEQGNADAMFYIGEIYKNGKGVMKDINKAAAWYLKAAELDHTEAQFNIGFCYKNGKGVPKNDIEALRWLEPAAEKGNMKAQYNMGIMCAGGRGMPRDDEAAANWYRKAAMQGYTIAMYNLGFMYQSGRGVERDYKEAVKWFKKSGEWYMDFLNIHTYGYLFVWVIIYSFFGWIYESLWSSFNERQWVNRGFLSGPVIPIYGFGAVSFVLLLSDINNPVYIFILGMVIASILEYFTSWAMEKLFHARWWDYKHYPFNLNGRICLYGALLFGFFAVIIIKVVQPYVAAFTSSFSDSALYILSVILMILFLTDTVLTVRKVLHLKERMQELQKAIVLYRNHAEEYIAEYKKYHQEQRQQLLLNMKAEFEYSKLYEVLKEKFGDLDSHERRILKAFPNLRSHEFDDAVIRIKNKLAEYKNRREKRNEIL